MRKLSYEIAKVNQSLRIKFTLITRNDESVVTQKVYKKNLNALYTVGNDSNETLVIGPTAFVTLDISKGGKVGPVGYDPNMYLALNRIQLYYVIKALKESYKAFNERVEEKENLIFYQDKGRLKMNEKAAREINVTLRLNQTKVFHCDYIIGKFTSNVGEEDRPGVMIYFGSISSYVFITFEEFEYLIYELERIDFTNLTMELLNIDLLSCKETNQVENVKNEVSEVKQNENPFETTKLVRKEPKTIPEI